MRLVIDVRVGAVTVPSAPIMQGPDGYYAYDGEAGQHRASGTLSTSPACRTASPSSTRGIANGDKVVVDGQYRLSEGSRVKIDTASPPAPAAATGKTG